MNTCPACNRPVPPEEAVRRPNHIHFHPACWEAVQPRRQDREQCPPTNLPPLTDVDDAALYGMDMRMSSTNTKYKGGRRHTKRGTTCRREWAGHQSMMEDLHQLAAGIQAIAPNAPLPPTPRDGDPACSPTSAAGGNA